MKILIYSSTFYPNIGGMETFVAALAKELHAQGYQVKLITATELNAHINEPFSFPVYRKPDIASICKLSEWCDVFLHNCISLKCSWMYILFRKKIFVTHQTWYRREDSSMGWQDVLKLLISRFIENISISQAIASSIPKASFLIPNFYQTDLFITNPDSKREKEIVFLGRLVSDKGADLLIEAIARLQSQDIHPCVTIIGKGPEEDKLRTLIKIFSLEESVKLVGVLTGTELVDCLNNHKILVVPSRWEEPFGIVALEGIACGCVVVGSEGGGLKEAIGPCGVTFPNGDVARLTAILAELLTDASAMKNYLQFADTHLQKHAQQKIAAAYIEVFQQMKKLEPALQ